MENKIRLAQPIEYDSVANGPGLRAVIWFQGCLYNCPGCHNQETQAIDGGYLEDINTIVSDIQRANYLDGVTLSGGEPFLQVDKLKILLPQLKKLNLNVWMYSGNTFENLLKNDDFLAIAPMIDVLIDGPFVKSKLNLDLEFRGSDNQRLIDVPRSLEADQVILYKLKTEQ